jgi:hypothetical protein
LPETISAFHPASLTRAAWHCSAFDDDETEKNETTEETTTNETMAAWLSSVVFAA